MFEPLPSQHSHSGNTSGHKALYNGNNEDMALQHNSMLVPEALGRRLGADQT